VAHCQRRERERTEREREAGRAPPPPLEDGGGGGCRPVVWGRGDCLPPRRGRRGQIQTGYVEDAGVEGGRRRNVLEFGVHDLFFLKLYMTLFIHA